MGFWLNDGKKKNKNRKYSRFTVVNSLAAEEKLKRISTWNRVALELICFMTTLSH